MSALSLALVESSEKISPKPPHCDPMWCDRRASLSRIDTLFPIDGGHPSAQRDRFGTPQFCQKTPSGRSGLGPGDNSWRPRPVHSRCGAAGSSPTTRAGEHEQRRRSGPPPQRRHRAPPPGRARAGHPGRARSESAASPGTEGPQRGGPRGGGTAARRRGRAGPDGSPMPRCRRGLVRRTPPTPPQEAQQTGGLPVTRPHTRPTPPRPTWARCASGSERRLDQAET